MAVQRARGVPPHSLTVIGAWTAGGGTFERSPGYPIMDVWFPLLPRLHVSMGLTFHARPAVICDGLSLIFLGCWPPDQFPVTSCDSSRSSQDGAVQEGDRGQESRGQGEIQGRRQNQRRMTRHGPVRRIPSFRASDGSDGDQPLLRTVHAIYTQSICCSPYACGGDC